MCVGLWLSSTLTSLGVPHKRAPVRAASTHAHKPHTHTHKPHTHTHTDQTHTHTTHQPHHTQRLPGTHWRLLPYGAEQRDAIFALTWIGEQLQPIQYRLRASRFPRNHIRGAQTLGARTLRQVRQPVAWKGATCLHPGRETTTVGSRARPTPRASWQGAACRCSRATTRASGLPCICSRAWL